MPNGKNHQRIRLFKMSNGFEKPTGHNEPLYWTHSVYRVLKGVHLRVYSLRGNPVHKDTISPFRARKRLHTTMLYTIPGTYLCQEPAPQNVVIMGLWRAQRCGKDAARCCGQDTSIT